MNNKEKRINQMVEQLNIEVKTLNGVIAQLYDKVEQIEQQRNSKVRQMYILLGMNPDECGY